MTSTSGKPAMVTNTRARDVDARTRVAIFWPVVSYWSLAAISIIYTFYIAPIVLRAISTNLYGIWSFLNGLIGYSDLLYLGFGTAFVKYLAGYRASANQSAVSRLTSIALSLYVALGTLGMVILVLLAFRIPALLSEPSRSAYATVVIIATVLQGARLLFQFVGTAFSGLLFADERSSTVNTVKIGVVVARFAAVPLMMRDERSLIWLSFVVAITAALEAVLMAWLTLRAYPELSLRAAWPTRSEIRDLYGFSLQSFVVIFSGKLINYTDTIVIGFILGPASVALYSFPMQIAEYARMVIFGAATLFMPHLTAIYTRGEIDAFRTAYLRATRLVCLAAVVLNINVLFLGAPFLNLWLGPAYGTPVTAVVLWLSLASVFQAWSLQTTLPFFQAMHAVRLPAIIVSIEAIVNLMLSVLFARPLGITGVALATVIPCVLLTSIVLPVCLARRLGLQMRSVLTSIAPVIVAAAVGVAVQLVLKARVADASYLVLFSKVLTTGALSAAVFLALCPDERRVALEATAAAWRGVSATVERRRLPCGRQSPHPGRTPQGTAAVKSAPAATPSAR